MPFGLCNAPATFQRFMLAFFANMVEKSIKVVMDDFSVFRPSFESCLKNFGNGTTKMHGNKLGAKLGQVPLHGSRRHSLGP